MAEVTRPAKFSRAPEPAKFEPAKVVEPAAKPVIPHRVSREVGTLLTFIVGAMFGAAIAIAGTTSILDPYAKALFQHDVAQHVYQTSAGQ